MKNIIQTTILLLSFLATVNAQPGTLDKTFSNNGKFFEDSFTGNCTAVAIQKDGKIVTGGIYDANKEENIAFIFARFNTDGSLDETFGENGKAIITRVENILIYDQMRGLSIQEDGKIIGCGRVVGNNVGRYSDIAVIRLNADGKLDNSFSDNGVLVLNITKEDQVTDMVLQTDGKILLSGDDGEESVSYITRILPDGKYDETFGEKGVVFLRNLSISNIGAITLQADNKILICGEYFGKSLFVMRFLPNGSFDNTFDEEKDGITGIIFADDEFPNANLYDIAVQPDGKILVAGSAGINSFYEIALARFKADGSIDSAFGDKTGYTVLSTENGTAVAYNVAVTGDKIILTCAYSTVEASSGFEAVRYNMDGTLDSAFGENGVAVTSFSNLRLLYAGHGAVQADGKIVIGGAGYQEGEYNFTNIALARFNNEIVLPIIYSKFAATQTKEYITLNWQTSTELNNKYFVVERSNNGVNYTGVAQVNSVATGAAVQNYAYTDKLPLAGNNYYRLKQVDKDGKFSYSKTINIAYLKPGSIQLFPNPAKDKLTVKGLNATITSTIAVLDIQGKQLLQFTAKDASYSFSIGSLAPGSYMVRVKDANGIAVEKFVKQ